MFVKYCYDQQSLILFGSEELFQLWFLGEDFSHFVNLASSCGTKDTAKQSLVDIKITGELAFSVSNALQFVTVTVFKKQDIYTSWLA